MSEGDNPIRPGEIRAPWTDDQVTALNASQKNPSYHPFTCIAGHSHGVLTATPDGWRCSECDYEQDWAWAHQVETAGTLSAFYQRLADDEKASAE